MHPSIDPDLQDLIKWRNPLRKYEKTDIQEVVAVHEGTPGMTEEYVWIVKMDTTYYGWIQAYRASDSEWHRPWENADIVECRMGFDTAQEALANWDDEASPFDFPISGKTAVHWDLYSQIEREELYPTSRSAGMTQEQALEEAIRLVAGEISAYLHDREYTNYLAESRKILAVLTAMRNKLGVDDE